MEVTPVVLHMSPRQKALDTGCFYRMVTTGLVNVKVLMSLWSPAVGSQTVQIRRKGPG